MPHETLAPAPGTRRPPLRPVWDLLSETYKKWRKDNAQTLGAALAFYTTFSMAPLLIIVIAIFGVILGKETVQVEILREAQELIGAQGAAAVKMMLEAAQPAGHGPGGHHHRHPGYPGRLHQRPGHARLFSQHHLGCQARLQGPRLESR